MITLAMYALVSISLFALFSRICLDFRLFFFLRSIVCRLGAGV